MGFYGSNDPTNSVKTLKEVAVLRIRLHSHQVHLTMISENKQQQQQHKAIKGANHHQMTLSTPGVINMLDGITTALMIPVTHQKKSKKMAKRFWHSYQKSTYQTYL